MTYLVDPNLLVASVPAGQLAALRPGDGVDQARGHGGHHDTHGASHPWALRTPMAAAVTAVVS